MNKVIKEVCGYSSPIVSTMLVLTAGRVAKFELRGGGSVLARFDDEQKARMYQDAYHLGAEAGYSIGVKKGRTL